MEKYMIAVDLDGTLIPDLYGLSDKTVEIFRKINEAGHKIIITTGRPFRSSYFVYHKFRLDTPMINYNGQLIENPRDISYPIISDQMPKEEILDVYNNKKGEFSCFFCEVFDTIYTTVDNEYLHPLMHHNMLSQIVEGDLNKTIHDDIHGVLILAYEGFGKEIEEYVNGRYKNIGARLWSWGPYKEIVELYSLNTNKGKAIRRVRDDLGFTYDSMIVCGDSINDFEFMKEGKIRITPSNADEKIKEMATVVLDKKCEEDAVALYLKDFLKIED